jgi:hypothetical protein
MKIQDIIIKNRVRQDYGDIQGLARDIKKRGLIQPVVVSQKGRLIAGERRIKAAQLLGWEAIPATTRAVPEDLNKIETEIFILKLEISENNKRKDFTIEEKVKYAKAFEDLCTKRAKERQLAGLKQFDTVQVSRPERCQTREKVGAIVGMSGKTYERAKAVVNSGDREQIDKMNAGGSILGAYNELKAKEKANNVGAKAQAALDNRVQMEKDHYVSRTPGFFSMPKATEKVIADAGISSATFRQTETIIQHGTDAQRKQLPTCREAKDVDKLAREVRKDSRDVRKDTVLPLLDEIEALSRQLEEKMKELRGHAHLMDFKLLRRVRRVIVRQTTNFTCLRWRVDEQVHWSGLGRYIPEQEDILWAQDGEGMFQGLRMQENEEERLREYERNLFKTIIVPAFRTDPATIGKHAFRVLTLALHPDRGGDEEKFKEVKQFYEYFKFDILARNHFLKNHYTEEDAHRSEYADWAIQRAEESQAEEDAEERREAERDAIRAGASRK